MSDQETVFRLYRRAQKFLALPLDEGIEPNDYGEGEEVERLIADLAVALSDAQQVAELWEAMVNDLQEDLHNRVVALMATSGRKETSGFAFDFEGGASVEAAEIEVDIAARVADLTRALAKLREPAT